MREVICLNVGQAGVQLSNAAWELFCIEHAIEANGLLKEGVSIDDVESFRTFFQEVPTGQFVPRTVSVDLEPTVIDEIRSGPYRKLFHPDQLISSMEDGASNFARGFFTIGKKTIDRLSDTIRKLADACESLQGFFMLHSVTGGTGSGFSILALDTLSLEFTKKNKYQISVFPSPILSTAIVEPYNCVLSTVRSLEKCELSSIMDNQAIFDICASSLSISRPTFSHLNRVISQVFSDLTASLRFDSTLNSDLDQLCTNLIPYPRIHFPVTCHAPLLSTNKASHDTLTTSQITKNCFDRSNQMVSCALDQGKYMCCVLQYRGRITPKDVNQAISEIKRKNEIKFVEWCPTGFKLGINSQPPVSVPGSELAQSDKSVTMLANSTSIKDIWEKIMSKFDILFSKRSFIYWYVGEGMEEGEFNEARDDLALIYNDYAQLETVEGDEEEEPVDPEYKGPNEGPNASVPSNEDEDVAGEVVESSPKNADEDDEDEDEPTDN